jgi:hypothetical protein
MECDLPCKRLCAWIETLPVHTRYTIPKDELPELPKCFSRTLLGEPIRGSLCQFRGPHSSHVHEFPDRWMLHRDRVNARSNPVGHLMRDAPEYLASAALGTLICLAAGRRSDRAKALLAGGLAGILALTSGKTAKLLNGDPSDGEGAPELV